MIKSTALAVCLSLVATGVFAEAVAVSSSKVTNNPAVTSTSRATVANVDADRKAAERLSSATSSKATVADVDADRKAAERLSSASPKAAGKAQVADVDADRKAAERLSDATPVTPAVPVSDKADVSK
jgi:hypothetical protein